MFFCTKWLSYHHHSTLLYSIVKSTLQRKVLSTVYSEMYRKVQIKSSIKTKFYEPTNSSNLVICVEVIVRKGICCTIVYTLRCTLECTVQCTMYSTLKFTVQFLVRCMNQIKDGRGRDIPQKKKFNSEATLMLGYNLLYIKMYSTVHSAVFSTVYSTVYS